MFSIPRVPDSDNGTTGSRDFLGSFLSCICWGVAYPRNLQCSDWFHIGKVPCSILNTSLGKQALGPSRISPWSHYLNHDAAETPGQKSNCNKYLLCLHVLSTSLISLCTVLDVVLQSAALHSFVDPRIDFLLIFNHEAESDGLGAFGGVFGAGECSSNMAECD